MRSAFSATASSAAPPDPVAGEYTLYLLRCADDTLYTGIARDVDARLAAHESGRNGAKYLRGRAPLTLVFQQPVGDRGRAQRLESRVKRLPRARKLALITGSLTLAEIDAG